MIQQEHFTRHNNSYTARFGKDDITADRMIELIPSFAREFTGQHRKYYFKSLHVERSREGVWSIVTEWYYDEYTPTGLLSSSYSQVLTHRTKPEEVEIFLDNFLPAVVGNIINGVVRGGEHESDLFLGHNEQPLFGLDGARIPDAAFDTTLAPTFTYHVPSQSNS